MLLFLLATLLGGLFSSLGAVANPTFNGGYPKCHGDMEYDPIGKLCKCDKGEYYDVEAKRCRIKEVEAIKVKKCAEDESLFCVRSEDDYVPYDKNSPYCWDDKRSYVICAKKTTVKAKFEIEKNYDFAELNIEEQDYKRKHCKKPRFYNFEKKECECPKNKKWDGYDCVFEPIPRPVCPRGESAYCAKNEFQIVKYSKYEKLCGSNGKNYVFCCKGDKKQYPPWYQSFSHKDQLKKHSCSNQGQFLGSE